MKITKEMLETICSRGENLERNSRVDEILKSCLRSAINGFDFESFGYNEDNQKEVDNMNHIAIELSEKHDFEVHFDGEEGNMYMYVSWD